MKIEDNILKHHLRNVLFVAGTPYGGKSTLCTTLANKYGFYHYRENGAYSEHSSYAEPKNQPNLCYQREDFNEYFNRPPKEQSTWLHNSFREEAEMEIIDLIKLSEHQKVITDTIIPIDILMKIAEYNQVVLLLSPTEMTVAKMFDRDDKQDMYNCIMSLPNPQASMKNFKDSLRYGNDQRIQDFKDSGFKWFMRKEGENLDKRVVEIEKHFRLYDNGTSSLE